MAKSTEKPVTKEQKSETQEEVFDKNAGVAFESLGIGPEMEPDRMELDARGPMQIIRYRIDTKTKYHEEGNDAKQGILKFDGFDIATGELVKYRTTSGVIIKNMKEISQKVGAKLQDIDDHEWFIFIKPINVQGFEKKKTDKGTYIRFVSLAAPN